MKLRKLVILSLVLLSATMLYGYIKVFHSDKEDAQLPQPDNHIICQMGFEDNDAIPSFLTKQVGTSYGLQIVGSPVYRGKKAARFELRCNDPENNSGTRTEISFPKPDDKDNLERWYAFALYFPRDDCDADNTDDVISQWHQGGKTSPSISLRTKNGQLYLRIKPDEKSKDKIELGDVEKEVWHYYVFHIKHSSALDGLIEIWRDGKSVGQYNGANMYDLNKGVFHAPGWKIGIYKSNWNGGATTNTKVRVVYFDEIKLGNEQASLADMMVK
ncbi:MULTISPECIES: polysaccharide lyase [Niastella]|uniref:Polysaccharide lyase n=1 Tax=Niastella soli TaxID=2821487 RepID=A0ABS3YRU2_9BACT|nr:polysaccharide lyase [Niastella soli]MBO9200503.1 polysaccharide lyase [Niastella soli]